jgi:hypothetical protein
MLKERASEAGTAHSIGQLLGNIHYATTLVGLIVIESETVEAVACY